MDSESLKILCKNSREKKAEDEFVGAIMRKGDSIIFRFRKDYENLFVPAPLYREYVDNRRYDGVLAFIVESPHVYEFKIDIDKYPKGKSYARPLNNPTTKKYVKGIIENPLREFLLENMGDGEIYLVLVVNSVQYQCSLGEKTNLYRDKLWVCNWLSGGEKDFLNRLKNYQPKLFVNCCTKGSREPGIKEYIDEKFMQDNFSMGLGNIEEGIDARAVLEGREFKNKNLSLQDIVEYSLEKNGLIKAGNYIRYVHPSYFVYQQLRGPAFFPKTSCISDKKIIKFIK